MPGFGLSVLPCPFFGPCRCCGVECGKAFLECHGNSTGRGLSAPGGRLERSSFEQPIDTG